MYTEQCIDFSSDIKKLVEDLSESRDRWIIFSKDISQEDHKAEYMIKQMFKAYHKHPLELPDYILARYKGIGVEELDRSELVQDRMRDDRKFKRCICDHIAGMTDQFAAREYIDLYEPSFR